MKLTQKQLRLIVEQTLLEALPSSDMSLKTKAALENPDIVRAVEKVVSAVGTSLFHIIGDSGADMLDQSLHTDFHNDLMNVIEEWINTYIESHERGEFA